MRVSRREALRLGAVAVGGMLGGLGCARPRPMSLPPPSLPATEAVAPEGTIRLAYGAEPRQFGELRLPDAAGPHPTAIVLHGDLWQADQGTETTAGLCEALRSEGLATWNAAYRRLGDPGGGWPGTFLDVAAAADHLRDLAARYPLDLRRVVAVGHSAGGQLSLWLAGRRWIREGELRHPNPLRLRGAVALAGVVDLGRAWAMGLDVVARLMGGTPDDVSSRYAWGSPAELLPLGVPQVLVHGTEDHVVPAELSREYHATAVRRGDEARLVTLRGLGHSELVDPRSPAWPTVRDAVVSLV